VSLKYVDATTKITESRPESTPIGYGGKFGRGSGIKNSLVIVDTTTFSVLHVLNNCALNGGSINPTGHTMMTLYGCHNDNFSVFTLIHRNN
jgi:hypothetical protein